MNFTYTKANGTSSKRVFMPLISPNTMYEGLDISELSDEDQATFCVEAEALKQEYLAKLNALQNQYDVVHSYRRFDPTKMSDVSVENI